MAFLITRVFYHVMYEMSSTILQKFKFFFSESSPFSSVSFPRELCRPFLTIFQNHSPFFCNFFEKIEKNLFFGLILRFIYHTICIGSGLAAGTPDTL